MTGPKLNEANRVAGSKSGSKASAKYVRSSASKARVVLNLVRNQDVRTADEILQFTDREMARVVRKVLASAVANATHNDELDADELFVKACFADEGPTLKRFRPRAKGRAGKINKRTCHITVIVDRMSDDQLAVREAKTMAKGVPTSNRRARVAASRKAAAPAAEEPTTEAPTEESTTTEEAGN
jgi:large subunit ribosomal protein L22